ncbi:hypothetical protein N0V90_008843 [Kalmusia sp. IMI 367209]|nr:hypothetical protein N0V90_008843 [Kalmusia sp. IMI 367209]
MANLNEEISNVEKGFGHRERKHEGGEEIAGDYIGETPGEKTEVPAPFTKKSSPVEERYQDEEEIARIPTQCSRTASMRAKSLKKITKTITARSNASIIDPGPPPDGGVKAWTQVAMGLLVITNTWVLLSALGIFMTSLCTEYYQFFLAQGLMNGIGNGCQFAPCMSLVTTYFARNRSVALAVMACGSAIGGLLYPTIARQLLPQIGFQWTVRVMGFIMLAVGACYTSLLRPRLPPRKSGPLFELNAFQEPPYTLYAIGLFLFCLGVYFAFYYISAYAVNIIGVSYGTSINLVLIMNGMGMPGRLLPGYIADRYLGPYNTIIPWCFITAIILYCWAAVKTEASLYAFTILYGFFSAGFQGLFPAVMASLTKDLSKVGTRNGMGLSVVGFASLTGPPIAGALIQKDNGGYLTAQMWAANQVNIKEI